MQRRDFIFGMPLALAACGAQPTESPPDQIASAAYHFDGPPSLTLFTVRNTGSGNGAHTGLMINASQRVMWDPAGSFAHPSIPEHNDVLFGITPRVEQFYISYHSRISYYTVIQTIEVPAGVAERALQLALVSGPVSKAHCTQATSNLLKQLPGFGSLRTTWFPDNLEREFGELPGVTTREYRETDSDDNSQVLAGLAAAPTGTP
jgi:hypothetical protein